MSCLTIARSINSYQIRPNDPQDHEVKLQVPCCSNFQKGKSSPGMRCYNLCSHTIALFGNDPFIQIAKTNHNVEHCHLQWQCILGHA